MDSGLSGAEISTLFAVWSVVGLVAEVPCGTLADRYSRRGALVVSGVLQAAGYLLWILTPGFEGFAAGFALWGVGGALASGAFEALLYDGLASYGAADRYATVLGRAEAAGFAVQIPIAGVATGLFALGGYALAAWVSIAVCLCGAALARTLPDRRTATAEDQDGGLGYLATLRAGMAESLGSPSLRVLVLAVALITGAEGVEEIFPLLAADWGIAAGAIPLALLAVPVAGALGSALGGRGMRIGAAPMAVLVAIALAAFGAAVASGRPAGVVGLTLFYGLLRLVAVVADARLQARIDGPARATVTSVASLGAELTVIALFAAWALVSVQI